MNKILLAFALLALASCGGGSAPDTGAAPAEPSAADTAVSTPAAEQDLAAILDAQPEDVKARYPFRKPQETLEFFGIEPGMTVVEALPGGGWYTKLLLPYLGESGQVIGADYPFTVWELNPINEERRERQKTWVTDWPAQAEDWRTDGDAGIAAYRMTEMPPEMQGTADAILLVRALHHLARWEDQAGTLTVAIKDFYDVLKPGGVVGVVQHEARPEMPDDWASGSRGYIKRELVIAKMEAAGFELVDSSDMHANPKDQPTTDDIVWRLPPTLGTSREDPELRERMQAIGESNRMTLKFRKPVS